MRILAVDYGTKRIGLAVCDEMEIAARPLTVIANKGIKDASQQVAALAKAHKAKEIVVGIPHRTDAKRGEMEAEVQRFIKQLRQTSSLPVTGFDERFTTKIAEQALLEADTSRRKRKQRLDKVAAAVLLQSYLEHRRLADSGGRMQDS